MQLAALQELTSAPAPTESNGRAENRAAEVGQLARRLASLLDIQALVIVTPGAGEWPVLSRHPETLDFHLSDELDGLLRSGVSFVSDRSGAEVTIAEPIRGGDGDLLGAVVVPCVGAAEMESLASSLHLLAPLASAALEVHQLRDHNALIGADLKQTHHRLQKLTEAISTGVAVVSPTGAIEEINEVAAEIIGVAPDEAIGRDFRGFVEPEDLERALSLFASRLAGDTARRMVELRVVRPSGERRLVQATSATMEDERGVIGVYFAARDVTDERSRESQLRRAERLASLAPLLGGVCHELNNPLTSIKSFAELMLLDDRPDEDVEALEIVRREAARAARIVTDLKSVARQTQDDGSNLRAVDVNDLVRHCCEGVREECAAIGAEVGLELNSSLPQIEGNRQQLERLVKQLLSNALQVLAQHPGTRRIEISTSRSDLGVALRVRDTGPGIAPEHVERVFDPFWTTRTTGEGTGLGLSLAHTIVTDHRGVIGVEGGWGSGATFTVQLPNPLESPAPAIEPAVQAPAKLPLRILVVDDEGPIRFSMMRYMARRGHTVLEAEEGARALALLESADEAPFDIILADLRMPGLNGEQLFQRLREAGNGMEQRLIFITGDAESPEAARVLEEAGVPVVLKPFELAEIAQIIEAQADVLR